MVFYVDGGSKMNLTELVSVGLMLFTPVITDIPEDKSASVECLALNCLLYTSDAADE